MDTTKYTRLTLRDLDEAIVLALGWTPVSPDQLDRPGGREGSWWHPSGQLAQMPPFHSSVNVVLRHLWPQMQVLGWRDWHVGSQSGVGYAVFADDDRCIREASPPEEHPAAAFARLCLAELRRIPQMGSW